MLAQLVPIAPVTNSVVRSTPFASLLSSPVGSFKKSLYLGNANKLANNVKNLANAGNALRKNNMYDFKHDVS